MWLYKGFATAPQGTARGHAVPDDAREALAEEEALHHILKNRSSPSHGQMVRPELGKE